LFVGSHSTNLETLMIGAIHAARPDITLYFILFFNDFNIVFFGVVFPDYKYLYFR